VAITNFSFAELFIIKYLINVVVVPSLPCDMLEALVPVHLLPPLNEIL
jgi:hypothetical protein